MQTTTGTKQLGLALPFVGREKEVARLKQLHAQRKHVLILGAAGVGKTALVRQASVLLPLLVCPNSTKFSDICDAMENALKLDRTEKRLPQRKSRLLKTLVTAGKTVVFDGVAWTTPKLSSFIDCISECVPVWICCRSEHPWDIGHFWPFLWKFARVELRPFSQSESIALLEAAVENGQVPATALKAAERLHHLAAGNPRVLCELLDELASGRYDPQKVFELKLLDLDRRIHEAVPGTSIPVAKPSRHHE